MVLRGPVAQRGRGLPDQVRQVRYTRADGTRLPAAALVRPDGYLAWASDERDASGPGRGGQGRRPLVVRLTVPVTAPDSSL